MKQVLFTITIAVLFIGRIASAEEAAASNSSGSSDSASPEGYWKTIDDNTGKTKSIVYIWKNNGKLYGKIKKLYLEPNEPENPTCEKCGGALKDKPVLGMRVLWDMVEDDGEWADGRIMDPENGKTYGCIMEVQENGKKLKVRGFIGVSLLGRTQYWLRTSAPK